MKRVFCGFAAWGLLMGLTGLAKAQYTFTPIDFPGATRTFANGINNAGQIVGQYNDASNTPHGFLLDVDGSYTTLDVPGAIRSTSAGGINDAGQIVGNYRDADAAGTYHGFVATSGG